MSAALEARNISVAYGGVRAVHDVSITVEPGELVGLIGSNGAGKTTFVDAVTGFVRARGQVLVDGADVSRLTAERRARAGLTRTWQAGELFNDLSVLDNLMVARHPSADPGERRRRAAPEDVTDTLELLGIADLADRMPSELTTGQRRLVGVARGLAARPRVLCLDEPAAGLDATESAELGENLRRVCQRGTGLLLVDHDMGLVLAVCDKVVVLEFGEVLAAGTPAEIRRNAEVIRAYLGEMDDQAVDAPIAEVTT